MTLKKWLDARGKGAMTQLVRDAGVTAPTVYRALRGESIAERSAVKIAKATGWEITVLSLIEGTA